MTSVASLLIAASTIVGQNGADEAFKSFGEFMVGGVWTRMDEDGNTLEHVYRWGLNDKFVRGESRKDPTPFHMVIGVDPASGKMTNWSFNGEGAVAVATWEKTGAGEWTAVGHSQGGSKDIKGTWVLKKVGANDLKIIMDVKADGEELKREITWTRK